MISICKEFRFDAAHFLPTAPKGHPNSRMHGHSFAVELTLEGEPDPVKGWIRDFADVERAIGDLRGRLDHHLLNEISGLEVPTLERVANPHADTDYLIRFAAPEFTTLCPVTGQPDFAHLVIDYAPGKWIVESKSLKLFLGSFRNHAGFHEDCTLRIGKQIVDAIQPKWLRIGGYWYPRGGIPIDVFWQTGKLPPGLWVPEQGVQPYRGRG